METSFQSNDETLQTTLYKAASLAGVILCPPHHYTAATETTPES